MKNLLCVLAIAAGCGGNVRAPERPDPGAPILEEAAGVRLLALTRPTPGRVWLSLFIDAGARDATPPQLATVAAWSVAGEGLQGRALADAIELSMPCQSEALPSCLDRMARALSTREVQGDGLSSALSQLRRARLASGADVSRATDALALEALLGEAVDPFGDPADDARVDEQATAEWLADHFGPSRTLLVAVGDLDADDLRDAAARAFADLPSAVGERADRDAPRSAARVVVGGADALSLASLLATPSAAASVARRWVARVGHDAQATVFPLRGGTALLLRRRGPFESGLDHAAQDMVDRFREVSEEPGVELQSSLPPPEDPHSLARWHGARWAAGPGSEPGGLGLGASVDGGRADRVTQDPDAAARNEALRALTAALDDDRDLGDLDEGADLDVRLDNGARIRARRLAGTENVSVTVLFEGGAREETRRAHGVTALLALVSARACTQTAPEELGAHPDALGITLRPHVETDRFGLVVSGPRARWSQVAYLAARCARLREVGPATVEAARLELARLPARELALAATISPGAPGRFAIRGATIPTASVDELLRWRDRSAVGARTRIGVAGDVELDRVVGRLARIARRYPAGHAVEADAWAGPPEALRAARSDETGAWIIRSAVADQSLSRVAAAFAAGTVEALRSSEETPLRLIGVRHGVFGGRAVVAVFVVADEASLAQLPTFAPAAPRDAWVAEQSARPWTPTATSLDLARGPLAPADPDEARALWRRLSEASPSFVVLRAAR